MMKMILILSFLSDFWLDILNLKEHSRKEHKNNISEEFIKNTSEELLTIA